METSFFDSLIEKIKLSSQSIKNKSLFTDQVFHLFTTKEDDKRQIILKSNNDLIVITNDGKTFKGKWEYLPEFLGIIIEFENITTTYKHSFLNGVIFALKLANSDKIDIYVNESNFVNETNKEVNFNNIEEYLYSLSSKEEERLIEEERKKLLKLEIITEERKREEEAIRKAEKQRQEIINSFRKIYQKIFNSVTDKNERFFLFLLVIFILINLYILFIH